ncbi:unnamed protein product [Angiostrongylus costaricensis]|uniref:EGF-like domain-containing protein n=1 Tax=Angiostrongylus costaricensis TaxID=334426 RepID=A0A0R3PH36_ANGCS|nr:unnamed protein product [Angiostrongylus costaricensis]
MESNASVQAVYLSISDTKDALDRQCRKLAPCKNNGYRSQPLGMLCVCIEPFFGEYCDKICNQGQVLKGVDGRSYCSCLPFYRGERCTEMVCLNGGTKEFFVTLELKHTVDVHVLEVMPDFIVKLMQIEPLDTDHDTIDLKMSVKSNELFSRDISGTAFSLVMIIVLVVSMYLLMKHRMQVQSRLTASRRDEIAHAAAMYGITRRGDMVSPQDLRIAPFIAAGIDGPPPYILHTYSGMPSL